MWNETGEEEAAAGSAMAEIAARFLSPVSLLAVPLHLCCLLDQTELATYRVLLGLHLGELRLHALELLENLLAWSSKGNRQRETYLVDVDVGVV